MSSEKRRLRDFFIRRKRFGDCQLILYNNTCTEICISHPLKLLQHYDMAG